MSNGNKFDKFTVQAKRVMSYAQEEAQRFQHSYIGTEHLLLGLIREGEGVAARVLKNDFGIELNKARSAVESLIGRGEHTIQGEIDLTPRAKKVIELAVEEACELKHHFIGTEHLLLGLVRETESIAAGILASLGVNLEKVRTQTLVVLTPTSVATAVPEKDPVRPCRVCGSPAPYDFNYCFHCGSELKPKGQGSDIFNYCFHCGAKLKSEEQEEL